MSALPLLAELADAGITLVRDGDNLRIRADKTIDLSAFAPRIREHKTALLDALQQQKPLPEPELAIGDNLGETLQPPATVLRRLSPDETETLGLDPDLVWLRVAGFGERVESTTPPRGWNGALPESCQFPGLCSTLGPCPYALTHCDSTHIGGA